MPYEGPWKRNSTAVAYTSRRLIVRQDQVIRPDGSAGVYDWVLAPDLVRVAAIVHGELVVVEQHHYLVGKTLQLPGGGVDNGESAHDAARRELREETGYHDGSWHDMGYLCPMPGLSPAKVHLWYARELTAGPATPEPFECDLQVRYLSFVDAVQAVKDGLVLCAASAALILAVAADLSR